MNSGDEHQFPTMITKMCEFGFCQIAYLLVYLVVAWFSSVGMYVALTPCDVFFS
ncbi:hypothetical protein BVRB_5g104990 [Beta vulgaris subsp. vulgaris]|nr:hypothetical protein BVRB_5g104990 [Beta vulgaris subsp. vulgaris]